MISRITLERFCLPVVLLLSATALVALSLRDGLSAAKFVTFVAILLSIVSLGSCVLVFMQITSSYHDSRKLQELLSGAERTASRIEATQCDIAGLKSQMETDLSELLEFMYLSCQRLAQMSGGHHDSERTQAFLNNIRLRRARFQIKGQKDDDELATAILSIGKLGSSVDIPELNRIKLERQGTNVALLCEQTIRRIITPG